MSVSKPKEPCCPAPLPLTHTGPKQHSPQCPVVHPLPPSLPDMSNWVFPPEEPGSSRRAPVVPWGPLLGKDPQEHTLLRFREEGVSGRALVPSIAMENVASSFLFSVGRGEKCLFSGKGWAHIQGPVPKPPRPSTCSESPVWARWAVGAGDPFVSGLSCGVSDAPSESAGLWEAAGRWLSLLSSPELGLLSHEMLWGPLAFPRIT